MTMQVNLAEEHPTELLKKALEILKQVKEDFLDYAHNVADSEYDKDKHYLWAYEIECAIKILFLWVEE